MSTEYRRGIPSVAHVEAATRLRLLWHRESATAEHRTQFAIRVDGSVGSDFGHSPDGLTATEGTIWPYEERYSYRPIRPDGTPVDWEVLDVEAARVAQPATVTSTASAAPTTQPQGFRADLWARLNEWVTANWLNTLGDIRTINNRGISGHSRRYSWDELGLDTTADKANRQALIARWAVYQELKPLYDIVDGAQGEVAMPRDVELAWAYCVAPSAPFAEGWFLFRDESGLRARLSWGLSWRPEEDGYGVPLRNFAAVLDAVAEQRVAARQGRAQPNTVTLPVDPSSPPIASGALVMQTPQGVRPATAAPEPRRFADVRPDRHGWRWWRMWGSGCLPTGSSIECQPDLGWRMKSNGMHMFDWNVPNSSDADRTVIPTDEQGNPVSWETIGQQTTQASQPHTLNLDDLTTLLRRHLGDDVSIVSLRRPRGVYRVQIDFADDTRTAGITAQNLPHNVSIWRSTRGHTCDFDLRGTDASTTLECNAATRPASAATSQPTYFVVDGDTVTTPTQAPSWLQQMCAEMRATATWRRAGTHLDVSVELPYGAELDGWRRAEVLRRVQRNTGASGRVTVATTNRPAPPVPVCLVAAMRRNQDLAVLQPDDAIPGERDATVAWAQMDSTTSQLCRNVVREIVEHGCYGLDDAAAAKRAGHYATLIAEAAAAKVETSSHVRAWCAQFQTRAALLEVDEGEVVNGATTSATLRLGTKPPTLAAIAKFRELMSSKMCPGRTEAAKQSGLDCEATQHVLLRWCSGLDDTTVTEVVGAVWRSFGAAYSTHQPLTRIDAAAQAALPRPALDVSGATTLDPALERARQAQEARRRSLAELQAQLQRERALRACADVAAAVEQPSRFALLEIDEAADPAASIARWQAGRAAAAGRRSVDVSPTAAKWQPPTAAPRCIDFDVPVRHDYVDVSDMPVAVQGAVVIGTLVDAVRRAGGMWEN